MATTMNEVERARVILNCHGCHYTRMRRIQARYGPRDSRFHAEQDLVNQRYFRQYRVSYALNVQVMDRYTDSIHPVHRGVAPFYTGD